MNPAPGPAGPAKSRLPDGLPGEFQRKAPKSPAFSALSPTFLRPSPACKGCMKGGERRPALSGKNRPMRRTRASRGCDVCASAADAASLADPLEGGSGNTGFQALRGADRRKSPPGSGMAKRLFPASNGGMRSAVFLSWPSPDEGLLPNDAAGKPSRGVGPFPASPQSLRHPEAPRNNALFPAFLPTLHLLQIFVRTFSHIFLPRQPESPRRPEGLNDSPFRSLFRPARGSEQAVMDSVPRRQIIP